MPYLLLPIFEFINIIIYFIYICGFKEWDVFMQCVADMFRRQIA